MPYNFQAGGANDAIVQVLAQRKAEEQRLMLQALAQQQAAEQDTRANAQLKLQQDQEARQAEAQKTAAADLAYNRRGVRAANLHENMMPGIVSPKAGAELEEFGYGGDVTRAPVTQGASTGENMPGQENVPLYDVTGGGLATSGGTKFQTAKQLAADKAEAATFAQKNAADIAAQNREAANARNTESVDARKEIAAALTSGKGDTNDLKRQLLQLDIDKKTGEAASLVKEKAAKLESVRAPAQDALDIVNSLVSDKGDLSPDITPVVGWGASIPGHTMIPSHATAISKIDRLKSLLVVDLMGQMKKQSRTGATGFGALSGPELKILEDSAARLSRTQSEDSFAEELGRLREKLTKILTDVPEAAAPGTTGATGGAAPAGAKVLQYNPATGKVE